MPLVGTSIRYCGGCSWRKLAHHAACTYHCHPPAVEAAATDRVSKVQAATAPGLLTMGHAQLLNSMVAKRTASHAMRTTRACDISHAVDALACNGDQDQDQDRESYPCKTRWHIAQLSANKFKEAGTLARPGAQCRSASWVQQACCPSRQTAIAPAALLQPRPRPLTVLCGPQAAQV